MLEVSRILYCPHQNIDIKTLHKLTALFRLFGPTHSICTVLWGAGSFDELCPDELNQFTNRWWVSEAVAVSHRKT